MIRKLALALAFSVILFVFSELMFRLALTCFGYPFLLPARYLEQNYYPFMESVEQAKLDHGPKTRNILILGGSVVNTHWSRLEMRLDLHFQQAYPEIKKFKFFNVAMPGHNSLDNAIKYRMLRHQKFDLVIYYEAINENRANNITTELFRADYGHIKWYDEINLLLSHPEMNFTVIPYALHLTYSALRNKLSKRLYISNDQVDSDFAEFGKDIKTALPYYQNLKSIASIADQKHEPLLLVKYASYFPPGVSLNGGPDDKKYFTPCYIVSPVTTWGKPEHIIKGIATHNAMLMKVQREHKTHFLDMSVALPKDSTMFCDVCHLSEQGAKHFAKELSKYIILKEILR